jgi:hypothetical protein
MVNWRFVAPPSASLTFPVNVKVPVLVGVPVMAPPLENVKPGGKAPDVTDHV